MALIPRGDPTHALYLDDSGQKEWATPERPYGPNLSEHFVLGGFLASVREAGLLARSLNAAKTAHLGTTAVEVKSNWLRIPKERKARYLDPLGITDDQLNAFVDAFYDAGCQANLVLLACVVVKDDMRARWATPWYPPAAAYEAIIQRAHYEMAQKPGARFSSIVDDLSGKTLKGREWAANLERHHEQMKQSGSNLQPGVRLDTLTGKLKLVDSALSPLIQLADLVAYNVLRQFRDHGEDWERDGLAKLPTYDWFAKIAHKFRRGSDGRIQGHGVIRFPTNKRIAWVPMAGEVVRRG